MAPFLAKGEVTFPSLPSLSKIPIDFSQPKLAALHCLTEKATWCFFWSCFLRMTEGKGEKHRTEKEPSFQYFVQQLMQWSCNKDLEGKDSACWWWIPEDCKTWGSREQAALKDFVHKPCFPTRCDKCVCGKAVAVPPRLEVQIPVSILSYWGERRKPRLRLISLTIFSLPIPKIESL